MNNYLISFFSLTLAFCFIGAQAAELEKSKLRSDQSFLDVQTGSIIYQNNVIYQHGEMTIHADKLIKQGDEDAIIIAEGNPVKVHHIDPRGDTTDIDAPNISYRQKTGDLKAQGAITIIQTSNQDRLTLIGNQLDANKKVTQGFNFVLRGAPTQFILKQPQQMEIKATAAQLRSNGKNRTTQLIGDVSLQQGTSSMKAAELTYDGASKVISANKSNDDSQRVETEFFWQKETQENEQQPASDTQ